MRLFDAFDKGDFSVEDLESDTVVSLWNMLRVSAKDFVYICMTLERISTFIEVNLERGMKDGEMPVPSWFTEDVSRLCGTLESMGLDMSYISSKRLLEFINGNDLKLAGKLRSFCEKLAERIKDELTGKELFMISPNRAGYYDIENTILGPATLTKMRDLRDDAEEAGNCFALGRYTACVFHLMRIMEKLVQRFGRKFRIRDLHKKTWGGILNELGPKISRMAHDTPAEEKKKIAYSHSYALLDAVCRATRNPTMHAKVTSMIRFYQEKEAKDLIDRVNAFANDFLTIR